MRQESPVTGDGETSADRLAVSSSLSIPLSELQMRFSASGGPGGQHANKVSTRVEVRFDVEHSPTLSHRQRARLLEQIGPEARVVADDERSQVRNRQIALDRLSERLSAALRVEKARRPTRPSRGATERRLAEKRQRSQQKRSRRTGDDD
ncbi:MAG: alternative ribosome rescue aminoacyl-tRNA hydrolase ArfB [Acidimicrobiales bacterium]